MHKMGNDYVKEVQQSLFNTIDFEQSVDNYEPPA